MSIAVSKVYETLSVLPVAYQEVQEGIEYSVLLGSGNIIYFWEFEQKRTVILLNPVCLSNLNLKFLTMPGQEIMKLHIKLFLQ